MDEHHTVMPPSPYMPETEPSALTDYERGEAQGRCDMWSQVKTLNKKAVPISQAGLDVLAERRRQIHVEGWTAQHDDEHDAGALAAAASAYALYVADELNPQSQGDGDFGRSPPVMWPFHSTWWKPSDVRGSLVKAAALALAELERFDRDSGGAQ
jgi:hypothetical protein